MTGASKNTIVKLLADAGKAYAAYQDQAFRNLPCKCLKLDEKFGRLSDARHSRRIDDLHRSGGHPTVTRGFAFAGNGSLGKIRTG